MNLQEIKTAQKDPNEKFVCDGTPLTYCLLDFWAWNQSDLIENRNRGILAEFIIKQSLGIQSQTRLEWDSFDLITTDNIKIEVKSAAYIQTWEQKKYSAISFGIKPTKTFNEYRNLVETSRQADVYIFCLLHHKDQATINPMNLEQWTFYLVTTKTLNEHLPNQKSLRISTIEKIPHEKCSYSELKERFEKLTKD